jgi:CDP-glucose 4,6-dehydratase
MKHNFDALKGKRIFVTGHTGFTGSWVSIWLTRLGAEVFGYSLAPETTPSLFESAALADLVAGRIADVRDYDSILESMLAFKPDLVLHLAAQPLVRRSYRIPRETFDVNTQGTANVLEAARQVGGVRGVLCITTDKVYKNNETGVPFKEGDELGGQDPYSASKSAAEIVISSFRESFSWQDGSNPLIAVARGGNIIGGGDWSEDRLIPDYVRAYETGASIELRYPQATRPWQHVLALAEGYLTILAGLVSADAEKFSQAFNLGPLTEESVSVSNVLTQLGKVMPGVEIVEHVSSLHEAGLLALDSTLASRTFGWNPKWQTSKVIQMTGDWYRAFITKEKSAYQLCEEQIDSWLASETRNLRG